MDKNQIIKTIKWLIIGVIVILLLRECRSVVDTLANKPLVKDSIIHTVDTIWAHDTTIILKPKKIFVPIVDTQWKPVYVDTSLCNRVYVSRDTFPDTNLILYTETHYQGILREIKPSYKLKVPIKIIDSVKILTEVPKLYPPVVQVHAGVNIGIGLLAPEIGFSYKRNTFKVGYNIQNKFPTIGYSFTIFRK